MGSQFVLALYISAPFLDTGAFLESINDFSPQASSTSKGNLLYNPQEASRFQMPAILHSYNNVICKATSPIVILQDARAVSSHRQSLYLGNLPALLVSLHRSGLASFSERSIRCLAKWRRCWMRQEALYKPRSLPSAWRCRVIYPKQS